MRRSAWLLGLAAAGAAGVAGREGAAAPVLRKQVDQAGDFAWIGNTVAQDCAAGARTPVVGTIGACGNNTGETAPDIFWRSDSPADGQAQASNTITVANARSTAVLGLPPGATLTYARLYWGAQLTTNTPDTSIVLDHIGVFAGTTITADSTASVPHPTSNNTYWYQGTAEITNLISANPLGAYRVSGIDSVNLVNLNSDNPFVAWSLVVFYTLPTDPPRNIALFDGLDVVSNNNPASATLSGFLVPNAGFDAKLGVLAYEGDNAFTGDSFVFNGTSLTDGVNPANNFFNGSRSLLGTAVSVTGDLPQMDGLAASMSGFDLDIVDISARVAAGQSSATIQATSTGDTYLLGAFATSISTYRPDFGGTTKTFTDLNGGGVFRNDVVEYSILATNSGNDTAVGVVMTDPLPAGVVYVPGSLQITTGANIGAKTDAPGDDQGEYNAGTRTLTVRLGTGADAVTGGSMLAGASTTIKFRVTVDTDGPTLIPNQATITASGQKGNPSTGYPTGNGSTTGTPTSVPVDECLVNGDCPVGKPLCFTTPNPNICVVCISDADCGATDSGRVCASPSQTCGNGCRGVGGNGCPAGQICSSTTTAIGNCTLPDGGAIGDGGNDDGSAGTGGSTGADSGDATGGAGGAAGSSSGGAAGSDGGGAGGAAGSDGGGGVAGTDGGRDGSGDGAAGTDGGGAAGSDGGRDGAAGTDGGRDGSGDGAGGASGAAGNGGASGNGGNAGDDSTGGAAGSGGAAGDSTTSVGGSLEGGGCACTTPGGQSPKPMGATLLGALAGAAMIRRKRRKS